MCDWNRVGDVMLGNRLQKRISPEKETAVETKGFVFRDRLSDYGFFTGDLKNLNPTAGVIVMN